MEFDNIETVKRAVEIDAGISIVPQGTVVQEVAKQTLAAIPIEDGDFPSAGGDLQKEQSAFARGKTVPDDSQGTQRESAYFRFAGFSGFKSFGTNRPSLRINSPSNHTSPPPHSGR